MILKRKKGQILFTKFKRNLQTVFLDPDIEGEFTKGKPLNIILSPSLYWVKKISLPVKYLREVKKLLPSIFEDVLPEGHYSYTAYKEDDEYFVFAYEDKKILDLLEKKGILFADVKGIYFAQAELSDIDEPLAFSDAKVLFKRDDIVIVTPKVWFSETQPLSLEEHHCHSKPLSLQQYGHIVDKGSLYKMGAMLVVLIVILFIETLITKQKANQIEEQTGKIFTKYHLQRTMMQNRAILEKYQSIYKKQVALRESIVAFLKMNLKKGQSITLVDFKNNVLNVTFKGVQETQLRYVLQSLKKKGFTYKSTPVKDGVSVEVML